MTARERQEKFLMAVLVGILVKALQGFTSPLNASDLVIEAAAIPANAFPDDIAKIGNMARDYLYWQFANDAKQPEWYKDEWISNDW